MVTVPRKYLMKRGRNLRIGGGIGVRRAAWRMPRRLTGSLAISRNTMPQPDLVIFDCDGVLVDSEIIAARVEAELLTQAGYEITAEEIVRNLCRPDLQGHHAEDRGEVARSRSRPR